MLDLTGKQILVTQSNDFMGPALCEALRQCGAKVIADSRLPIAPNDAQEMIEAAGYLDVLVLNLALRAPTSWATDIDEQ